jgi:DNA-binding IscR family transcriptional regulator
VHSGATPAECALRQVLAEIDQTTKATLGSITIATMMRMTPSV